MSGIARATDKANAMRGAAEDERRRRKENQRKKMAQPLGSAPRKDDRARMDDNHYDNRWSIRAPENKSTVGQLSRNKSGSAPQDESQKPGVESIRAASPLEKQEKVARSEPHAEEASAAELEVPGSQSTEDEIQKEIAEALAAGEAAGQQKRQKALLASKPPHQHARLPRNERTTGLVTFLAKGDIFVFGSNEAGRHGKGAAKLARQWGAKLGQAEGLQGDTYGIPTKNAAVSRTLSISQIGKYVANFVGFARDNPELTFLVTEIGCGLADWTPTAVAPLFAAAKELDNIHLPASFWTVMDRGGFTQFNTRREADSQEQPSGPQRQGSSRGGLHATSWRTPQEHSTLDQSADSLDGQGATCEAKKLPPLKGPRVSHVCAKCKQPLLPESFSSSQLKKQTSARCRTCVG